ncbi:MAG: SDR family NAD(P)-dependent oxidoreductase [Anaerolineales bacterium]|jgi:NAD(P)-dependent dehydrogenase (short-subunit alcohol dehydrogenase family)|nr:SDR family NAD(P)-dependent oxidoreductase [Anaerolineales bacterium]
MQSVVVSGVSTGIGWAVTKMLIERGFRVFGSLRKETDAERLKKEFGAGFIPLLFDVTDEARVQAAAQSVREQLNGETLFGLVNNAGIALPAPLMHQPISDFRKQIEVNLIAQFVVTQAFLPLLGVDRGLKGKPGRIVNISSSSGKNGSPFVGAYATSKHALEGFSESLRRELMLYGIEVIIVGPGPIATPIWEKADQMDFSSYQNTEYMEAIKRFQKYATDSGRKGYPPEKVAQVVLRALTSPRPRVRYAVVPGNPIVNLLQEILPKRMLDEIIARGLGLKPKR